MFLTKNDKNRICRAFSFIPDKTYLRIMYLLRRKTVLDLSNPTTFSAKIQWIKLNYRNPLLSELVDKFLVRDYVKDKIGYKYLIPILGVWNCVDEIDFQNLPNQFVIKCTHDSGSTVICKDKLSVNLSKLKKELKISLKQNLFYNGREWAYKNVKPRIIVEQYMEDNNFKELRDYKFFCFNGKVKLFKIDYDRFTTHHANYYDINKKILPIDEEACPRDLNKELVLPRTIDRMIQIAEKLSNPFPFVRVDLYDVNGLIYFGELTFYPGSGFIGYKPEEWDNIIGSWLKLPEV